MVNENVVEILNEQINKEFYSGYLYLSMAGYFCGINFQGFANFAQEYSKKKIEAGAEFKCLNRGTPAVEICTDEGAARRNTQCMRPAVRRE